MSGEYCRLLYLKLGPLAGMVKPQCKVTVQWWFFGCVSGRFHREVAVMQGCRSEPCAESDFSHAVSRVSGEWSGMGRRMKEADFSSASSFTPCFFLLL